MPNSLEELSQHAGRAGRNRQISSTYLLFYREKNKSIHVNHISETENVKVQLTKMKKLAKVIEFATLMTCRQSFLQTYFGKIEAIPCQTSCDNCLSPPKGESLVITNDAKNLLKIVAAVGNLVNRASPSLVAKTFTGSLGSDVKKHKLDELNLHGSGKKYSVRDVENIINTLIIQKYLVEMVVGKKVSMAVRIWN